MARISKKSDAPEGPIKVTIGQTSFKVADDAPYETDDRVVIEIVEVSYGDFLTVETDEGSPVAEAKAEAKALNKLHKEQEKAKLATAVKDPTDPAPEVPSSIDDITNTDSKETN
jgi:hypothetical protein